MLKSNLFNFITVGLLSVVLIGSIYHYNDIIVKICELFRL